MKKESKNHTFETKCRRCNHITEWYGGTFEMRTSEDFKRYMHEKMTFPSVYDCKECDKKTVQDVVAFSE